MSRVVSPKPGEVVLATRDGWTLVERPHAHRSPWLSLRAIRISPGPGRRSIWLGACPERMARHADFGWLVRNHPDVAAWVDRIAVARAADLARGQADAEGGR